MFKGEGPTRLAQVQGYSWYDFDSPPKSEAKAHIVCRTLYVEPFADSNRP